ncbi:hypothetical protein VPH35_014364 [Triticum aestivum]|uniref:Uncharacterized protein n=1 Tax=Aegilops tauschii subsp. strangulata TaxID=200361 RepID=A0A452YKJ5_AEGTS
MVEQVAVGAPSYVVDEDHIYSLLASMNTCIRWVAWIGAMLVVGSSRPGDDTDEDPPCNGVILLGWHNEDQEAQPEASRDGVRASQRQKSRTHFVDVVTN